MAVKNEKVTNNVVKEAPKVIPSEPKKLDKTLAIVGLVLNIIILPGLGTLIGGGKSRASEGTLQLVLAIISIPLMFVLIGFFSYFAMWVWALVSGIKMVQEAAD